VIVVGEDEFAVVMLLTSNEGSDYEPGPYLLLVDTEPVT
jgi:hypothetical protein